MAGTAAIARRGRREEIRDGGLHISIGSGHVGRSSALGTGKVEGYATRRWRINWGWAGVQDRAETWLARGVIWPGEGLFMSLRRGALSARMAGG